MNTLPVMHRLRIEPRELLAFAAIYLLWGGTFLAIRTAVLELPPVLTAGARFFLAGLLLYGFKRLRGAPNPSALEWRNLALLALLMFVLTYGPLFWAARYVTSSVTAVLEATLPITTIVLEVAVFKSQTLTRRLALGVGLGFTGVVLLLFHNAGQQLAGVPCLVILGAGITWSLGTVLSRQLTLPASSAVSAGAQMMLGGFALLVLSFSLGELPFHAAVSTRAAIAVLYLVVFGSLIAYLAYMWLLGRYSATRVASHAYVNPLIAVGLGYFVAGEALTFRSILASLIIVASVFLLLSRTPTAGSEGKACTQRAPASA